MTALAIVSLVSMLGWLFLVGSELKAQRLPRSKLLKMALLWVGIFAGAAALFGAAG